MAAALGLGLTLSLAGALPSAAQQATREQVYERLDIDREPADYVLLIDTSGSMNDNGLYREVGKAVRGFVAALTPQDHLSLITFDVAPALRYAGPVTSPRDVAGRLPARAEGARTDIGAAIEAAVDLLQRPGASRNAAVVLLTDGAHDPPQGSGYPTTSAPAWGRLRAQAARLPSDQVRAFAIPLKGSTGAALLKRVFPDATVLGLGSTDQLGALLNQPKDAVRADKARETLRRDAGQGVRVEWGGLDRLDLAAGAGDVDLTLRSTAEHVPLVVTGMTIHASGLPVQADSLPGTVALDPGESWTRRVHLTWAAPSRWRLRETLRDTTTLELAGQVTSPWATVLSTDLGLPFDPGLVGGRTGKEWVTTVGWALTAIIAAGALLLLLVLLSIALLWIRWRRRNPRLDGVLSARSPSREYGRLRLVGRSVRIGAGSPLPVPGTGTVRGRWRRLTPGGDKVLVLVITYDKDGAGEERRECAPGGSRIIRGVNFVYSTGVDDAGGPPRPRPSRPAGGVDPLPPGGSEHDDLPAPIPPPRARHRRVIATSPERRDGEDADWTG